MVYNNIIIWGLYFVFAGKYQLRERQKSKLYVAKDLYPSEDELSEDDRKYPPRTRKLREGLRNYDDESDNYIPSDQDEEEDDDSSSVSGEESNSDSADRFSQADMENKNSEMENPLMSEAVNGAVDDLMDENLDKVDKIQLYAENERMIGKHSENLNPLVKEVVTLLDNKNLPVKSMNMIHWLLKKPELCHTSSSIYVPKSSDGGYDKNGNKKYEKPNCCSYCLKIVNRIDKHYVSDHKDEEYIKFILSLPKGRGKDELSKQQRKNRRRHWDIIKAPGNMIFNLSKRLNPTGIQIVKRRALSEKGNYKNKGHKKKTRSEFSIYKERIIDQAVGTRKLPEEPEQTSKKSKDQEFDKELKKRNLNWGTLVRVSCTMCGSKFSPNSLGYHMRDIHGTQNVRNCKSLRKEARAIFQPADSLANDRVRFQIFPKLRDDEIAEIIKGDQLIIAYANFQADKFHKTDMDNMIKQDLRLLGTVVQTMRTKYPKLFKNLVDGFNPRTFKEFMDYLAEIVGMNFNTNLPEHPARAKKLVFLIEAVIETLSVSLIMIENQQEYDDLSKFRIVYKKLGHMYLGRKEREERRQRSRHEEPEKSQLPDPEEKLIFEEFLTIIINDNFSFFQTIDAQKIAQENDSSKIAEVTARYEACQNCLVIRIILFNIRRPGEVSISLLEDYKRAKRMGKNDPEFRMLDEKNKLQFEKYLRVLISGKKVDGEAPFYLTQDDIKVLNFLIELRSIVGIPPDHPFLFAVPPINPMKKEHRHVDAYIQMVKLSEECSVKFKKINHKLMRCTKFRKLAAQLIDLNDDIQADKDIMYGFMAHKPKTHQTSYRGVTPRMSAKTTIHLETMKNYGRKNNSSAVNNSDLPVLEEERREEFVVSEGNFESHEHLNQVSTVENSSLNQTTSDISTNDTSLDYSCK